MEKVVTLRESYSLNFRSFKALELVKDWRKAYVRFRKFAYWCQLGVHFKDLMGSGNLVLNRPEIGTKNWRIEIAESVDTGPDGTVRCVQVGSGGDGFTRTGIHKFKVEREALTRAVQNLVKLELIFPWRPGECHLESDNIGSNIGSEVNGIRMRTIRLADV